jgi:hypothetical protein
MWAARGVEVMVKGVTSIKGAVVCCRVGAFARREAADTTLETAAWGAQ